MSRRLSAFALCAGLVAAQIGCSTSRCDSRPGLFTAHTRGCAPCQTVGNGSCFDAATGQPCPCPPEAPGMVVPGAPYPPIGPLPGPGGTFPPPGELHMPSPSDMIRPPAVPIPAPGDASLPFPVLPGTPVKSNPNR